MKQKIWYITSNNGDGSSTTEFYDSKECINRLCSDEYAELDDSYQDGDGGSYGSFEIEGTISGITIKTMEDIEKIEEEIRKYR